MTDQDERPRLRDAGQVYVTHAAASAYARDAARVYAEGRPLQIEEARRELTELAMEAKRIEGDTETPERWRFRRSSLGVDLTARIVRERSQYSDATILVVVSITARPYSSARRR